MSRRFQGLLDRYAAIRRAIDLERNHPHPSLLRLLRLKRLQLLLDDRIRAFVELSAIRRASVPRFLPAAARLVAVRVRASPRHLSQMHWA